MNQSQTKKVYIYPIKDTDGTPLDLINVLTRVLSTGASSASSALDKGDWKNQPVSDKELDRIPGTDPDRNNLQT